MTLGEKPTTGPMVCSAYEDHRQDPPDPHSPETDTSGLIIAIPPVVRGGTRVLEAQEWGLSASTTVIGVVGINGAGKSSLFLALTDLLITQAVGSIRLGNQQLCSFSFLPQQPLLPPWLTTTELMATHGFTLQSLREKVPGLRLSELAGIPASQLSEGQAQAIALSLTLGADADVYVLDEPMSALDLRRRKGLRDYLLGWRARAAGRKVAILSTQSVSEITDLCDAMVVLHEGRCRYCGRLEDLVATSGRHSRGSAVALEDAVVALMG